MEKQRKYFVQEIKNDFPSVMPLEIYDFLKSDEAEFLTVEDLLPYCEKTKISPENLRMILSNYGLINMEISKMMWLNLFLDNPTETKIKISGEDKQIIDVLITAIYERAKPPSRLLFQNMWAYCQKYAPLTNSMKKSTLPVTALMAIAKDCNIIYDWHAIYTALCNVLQSNISDITTEQFNVLIQVSHISM